MPTTAKGANVFHASQAGIHADGDLNDQGSNSGHEEQDQPQTLNGDTPGPAGGAPAHDSVTPHHDMALDMELA